MITPELVRTIPLFAKLPEDVIAGIAQRAADIHLREGEWFANEGETPAFFALLAGRFEIVKRYVGSLRRIAVREPGEYLGETPIMLGGTFFVGARTLEPSRLMRLEASDLRSLVRKSDAVRAEILETVMQRVGDIGEGGATLEEAVPLVIGGRSDPNCHDLRDFLSRNRQPYEWYDPAERRPCRVAVELSPDQLPAVVLPDGTRLLRPTNPEIAGALGMRTEPSATQFDVAVIGGGPAGLAAAVYGASEGLRTLLIERYATGGQAGTSSRIENYLGFPSGISGDELAHRAHAQAERFGSEIVVAREAQHIYPGRPFHRIELSNGASVEAHAILIATGVSYRSLDVPNIDRYLGAGVFYGAARTEARAMVDHDIVLVGGGNSAGQAAMFFSNYARSVTILIRGSSLSASMSQYLIDEIGTKENVTVQANSEIVAVEGDVRLEAITIRNKLKNETARRAVDAVFVFIGADALTDWLPPEVICDERGYVCTGRDVLDLIGPERPWPHERDPLSLETSVPGIFAAGDVRHGSIKRVSAGVGEGSMSIAFVHDYLQSLAPEGVPA